MIFFDKFKKNVSDKMDIFDIPYDYDGYDIVYEKGKTDFKLYDEFNKILTNEKYDISTLNEYKKLSRESDMDDFYEFYNSWIENLRRKKFVFYLDNSISINEFAKGINDILNAIGSYKQIDEEVVAERYKSELKKYSFQGNKIEENFRYDILKANIVAYELRKINYELINLFDGFNNNDMAIIQVKDIENLKIIESKIKKL